MRRLSAAEAAQQSNRDPVTKRYRGRPYGDGDDGLLTGPRHALGAAIAIARMIPYATDDDGYYESTRKKHFDAGGHGSMFTDPDLHTLEDVLHLAWGQRGNLDGDDRAEFIARGAVPDAFTVGNRYLLVRTPGTVGVLSSVGLDDGALVQIVRGKPGAPCSIVCAVSAQETIDYAAVIIGDGDGGEPVLITMFPGPVTRPTSHPEINALEGQTVTLGRVREILGSDTWLNTRLG